jgi:hypothetical protein
MEYGTIIKNKPPYKKSGVLRFETGKECKLTEKEMEDFDDWVRLRILQYGGKVDKMV